MVTYSFTFLINIVAEFYIVILGNIVSYLRFSFNVCIPELEVKDLVLIFSADGLEKNPA